MIFLFLWTLIICLSLYQHNIALYTCMIYISAFLNKIIPAISNKEKNLEKIKQYFLFQNC